MNLSVWLLTSLILWFAGKNMADITLLTATKESKDLILPPKWLFYMCGAPKKENMLLGVIPKSGLGLQLSAYIFIILRLSTAIEQQTGILYIASISASLLLGSLISEIINRIWHYDNS